MPAYVHNTHTFCLEVFFHPPNLLHFNFLTTGSITLSSFLLCPCLSHFPIAAHVWGSDFCCSHWLVPRDCCLSCSNIQRCPERAGTFIQSAGGSREKQACPSHPTSLNFWMTAVCWVAEA